MILKFIYTIFIGILLATFIGVGIAAFYPGPKEPEYPSSLKIPRPEGLSEPVFKELKKDQENYDKQFKTYLQQQNKYSRNVSIIAVLGAMISLVISLTLFSKIMLIADGLLLGGVMTLIYSIFRGFMTDDNIFRFIVVAIGFTTALVLGYIKFIKSTENAK